MGLATNKAMLVAYDISDDRKRRNLYNHLAGYGTAIQESLFYCQLDNIEQRRKLGKELNDLPLDTNDRLHCFLIDVEQSTKLSPSSLTTIEWVAE